MITRRQRRLANRQHRQRQAWIVEYYRDIRALYSAWWSKWYSMIPSDRSALYRAMVLSKRDEDDLEAISTGLALTAEQMSFLSSQALADWEQTTQSYTIRMRRRANNIARLTNLQWTEATELATGSPIVIDPDFGVNPFTAEPWLKKSIENFTAENINLIKGIGQETAKKVQTLVSTAVQQGTSTADLARSIEALGEQYKGYRSRLIARDQISKYNGELTRERNVRAGLDKYQWVTVGDERVRSSHEHLNNTIRDWKQIPYPGNQIQCRCFAVSVVD